nr:pyridoxine/pyridoxamine 5'-phosphate oxidase 1, chloroplastic isoform X1 [Ipomoea batatas]
MNDSSTTAHTIAGRRHGETPPLKTSTEENHRCCRRMDCCRLEWWSTVAVAVVWFDTVVAKVASVETGSRWWNAVRSDGGGELKFLHTPSPVAVTGKHRRSRRRRRRTTVAADALDCCRLEWWSTVAVAVVWFDTVVAKVASVETGSRWWNAVRSDGGGELKFLVSQDGDSFSLDHVTRNLNCSKNGRTSGPGGDVCLHSIAGDGHELPNQGNSDHAAHPEDTVAEEHGAEEREGQEAAEIDELLMGSLGFNVDKLMELVGLSVATVVVGYGWKGLLAGLCYWGNATGKSISESRRFRGNTRLRLAVGEIVKHSGSPFVGLPSLKGLREAHIEVDAIAFLFFGSRRPPLLHEWTQDIHGMPHDRSLEWLPGGAVTSQLSNLGNALIGFLIIGVESRVNSLSEVVSVDEDPSEPCDQMRPLVWHGLI